MAAFSPARRVARSRWIGWLGRAGFAAQGTCFAIIAVLALALAFGRSGRLTDPRGAFVVLARGGWTRVLLVFLAIGFSAYSIWRLAQAVFDRGGMGTSLGGLGRRAIQFGQATLYALLTFSAVRVLDGARSSGSPSRAAAGVLGWPGGPEIVGVIGAAVGVVALVNLYWGLSGRFTESIEPGSPQPMKLIGTVGFVALGFVLAVISWFLLKAATDYNAHKVVSLGGAMSRLARADYGDWLLTAVAAGLLAYGLFGLLQARYHRV